jgi:hypothetical protein
MRRDECCQRCLQVLVPLRGTHTHDVSALERAITSHGQLTLRAWRSGYPQEGGDYLYHCRECGIWWQHQVWTCVTYQRLTRPNVSRVEDWVAAEKFGEVVPESS